MMPFIFSYCSNPSIMLLNLLPLFDRLGDDGSLGLARCFELRFRDETAIKSIDSYIPRGR